MKGISKTKQKIHRRDLNNQYRYDKMSHIISNHISNLNHKISHYSAGKMLSLLTSCRQVCEHRDTALVRWLCMWPLLLWKTFWWWPVSQSCQIPGLVITHPCTSELSVTCMPANSDKRSEQHYPWQKDLQPVPLSIICLNISIELWYIKKLEYNTIVNERTRAKYNKHNREKSCNNYKRTVYILYNKYIFIKCKHIA